MGWAYIGKATGLGFWAISLLISPHHTKTPPFGLHLKRRRFNQQALKPLNPLSSKKKKKELKTIVRVQMLTIARNLSLSKKLKHPRFLSLSILAQSLTNPCSSSSLSQTLNPQPQSPIKPPPLNSFYYFSSIPSLPLTRNGN
jgi:hypothetical protein